MADRERGRSITMSESTLPVFRLRDLPMEPRMAVQREMCWMQFTATVQLRLKLAGSAWEGVRAEEFQVKVSPTELSVKCSRDKENVLESMNGKLKREVNPKGCWFDIERDVQDPFSRDRFLVVELVKKGAGMPWEGDEIFQDTLFQRKAFCWNAAKKPEELEQDQGWVKVKAGRRPDVDDPFVTSRGWLCTELEQGQTDEVVQFRIVLDQKKFDEALEKVPYFSLFGADCSEKYLKLFIRGDESEPILLGEFGGRVLPHHTMIVLATITREVEGHRIQGFTETLPCLEVTIQKAEDALGEWQETIMQDEDALNQPQGSLEEFEKQVLRQQREPSPDREDWTPDDWADEQKDKADAAFKAGDFRDAIVYYTRALRFTPLNNKLLSNRSAAYLRISKFQLALDDAVKAEEIDPNWSKVYFRKGQALRGLRRFDDAIVAFQYGKDLDPDLPAWGHEMDKTKEQKALLAERRKAKGK